jgi:hypothetical protein
MKASLALIMLLMGTSAAYGADIYTWKDSRGTAHYTNSMNEIPSRYLKRAKVLDVATGKTGGPAVGRPAAGPVSGSAGAPPGQNSAQAPMAPAVIVPPPAAPPQAPAANGVVPQGPGAAPAPPPGGMVTRPSVPTPPRSSLQGRRARRHGGARIEEE